MPKPIHLALARVKEAGLKAYHEKRLSAQGPFPQCAYRDRGGRPCIIGAAIDTRAAHRLDREADSDVVSLAMLGLILVDDVASLAALQDQHDHWVNGDIAAEGRLLALLEGREP